MHNMLELYPLLVKHYVITKLGIYSINLTLDAQILLNKEPNVKDELGRNLKKYYESIEQYREMRKVNESDREYNINQFLYTANSKLTNELIYKFGEKYNFSIFIINFYSWDNIIKNGGILDYMVDNNDCPGL